MTCSCLLESTLSINLGDLLCNQLTGYISNISDITILYRSNIDKMRQFKILVLIRETNTYRKCLSN